MIRKYIDAIIGIMKITLFKVFHFMNTSISYNTIIHPSVTIQLSKKGFLTINKDVSIRRNTEINIRNNAVLSIGQNSFFNSGCIVTAHKKIIIGENVEFGPYVQIYDHDHKYKNGYSAREFETDDIIIGNNVWIGANSIILRGTVIGDNCVIAAGSVIKSNIPKNTIVYQKKNTVLKQIDNNIGV